MFDLHIHTILSACCHDNRMTPLEILRTASQAGLTTVGFTDHTWEQNIPGASEWYKPQIPERLLTIRSQIMNDTSGIRVLIGCETEYLGNGVIGLSQKMAEQFDYVLIPATHFHMVNYVAPQMHDCKQVAWLMKKRFDEITSIKIEHVAVAHPFLPLGYLDDIQEIFNHLSDNLLFDSFTKAANAGIGIEITTEFFPSLKDNPAKTWPDDIFLRILKIAVKAGCKFHLASDAHKLEQIGWVNRLGNIIKTLNITEDLFWLSDFKG